MSLSMDDLGITNRNRELTGNEMDSVIAALRLWQRVQDGSIALVFADGGPCGLDYFEDVATCSGQHAALTIDQIDVLLDDVYAVAS